MERRARLEWRCRRGMLELDLLLQGFLERGYERLSPAQRLAFERLLELPEATLYALLLGSETSDDREIADVIENIRRAIAS